MSACQAVRLGQPLVASSLHSTCVALSIDGAQVANTLIPKSRLMFDRKQLIQHTDPELFTAIEAENLRQEQH
ncbi:MAG: hypothetical protein QMC46_08655, partial [Burkholderiaceae bacterium]